MKARRVTTGTGGGGGGAGAATFTAKSWVKLTPGETPLSTVALMVAVPVATVSSRFPSIIVAPVVPADITLHVMVLFVAVAGFAVPVNVSGVPAVASVGTPIMPVTDAYAPTTFSENSREKLVVGVSPFSMVALTVTVPVAVVLSLLCPVIVAPVVPAVTTVHVMVLFVALFGATVPVNVSGTPTVAWFGTLVMLVTEICADTTFIVKSRVKLLLGDVPLTMVALTVTDPVLVVFSLFSLVIVAPVVPASTTLHVIVLFVAFVGCTVPVKVSCVPAFACVGTDSMLVTGTIPGCTLIVKVCVKGVLGARPSAIVAVTVTCPAIDALNVFPVIHACVGGPGGTDQVMVLFVAFAGAIVPVNDSGCPAVAVSGTPVIPATGTCAGPVTAIVNSLVKGAPGAVPFAMVAMTVTFPGAVKVNVFPTTDAPVPDTLHVIARYEASAGLTVADKVNGVPTVAVVDAKDILSTAMCVGGSGGVSSPLSPSVSA